MANEKIYLNNRFMGERADAYVPGKLHPVYLGDILNDRYHVFRKLGSSSQATVWLVRDSRASERRFTAVKVFSAKASKPMPAVIKSSEQSISSGAKHVERALDSFMIHGPNGDHFCIVVEPLGYSFYSLVDQAFETRCSLNGPKPFVQGAVEGDHWSVEFAKRACWQILSGLDYLHQHRIAHRDVHPRTVAFSLEYELSDLTENEIQKDVWPSKEPEPSKGTQTSQGSIGGQETTSSDDSSDSDEGSLSQWEKDLEECKRRITEQWQAYDRGDVTAEPHSELWNKGNFYNTRNDIELLQRRDGKALTPDEIHYTVAATPLPGGFSLQKAAKPETKLKLVLTDVGFACTFDECEQRPLPALSDLTPPEGLLGIPITFKADIFSLGLLFWEAVMLRRLVEGRVHLDDTERIYLKNRQLRDLVQRLGPAPPEVLMHWRDADEFVDSKGNALDMQEQDEDVYGPDDFEYGDIWHHAKKRKPLDMTDEDMTKFVCMVQRMLQWNPNLRPSTTELLQDEWFSGL